MALKVRINGQMQQITGSGNKPVVFINGVKKKLVKGVTFINGEKKLLWGQTGIIVDVIDYAQAGILTTINITPVWASNNHVWANIRDAWYKISVSNISNPSIAQSVSWGGEIAYSNIDSTQATVFFTASDEMVGSISGKSHTYRKISIGADGAGVVTSSANYQTDNSAGFYSVGLMSNGWFGSMYINRSYYWALNGQLGQSATDFAEYLVKFNNSLLLYLAGVNIWSVNSTNQAESAIYAAPGRINDLLVDGDSIIVDSAAGVVKTTAGAADWTYESDNSRLIGKILNYYVIIDSGVVKILSDTTGAVEQEYEIPEIATGNSSLYILPTVSQTGYLAFSYNKKFYRISLA